MDDHLYLTTSGSNRDEALEHARALAAEYYSTYPESVKGKVVDATAETYETYSGKPEVIHFTVRSVWFTLDSQTEWVVG